MLTVLHSTQIYPQPTTTEEQGKTSDAEVTERRRAMADDSFAAFMSFVGGDSNGSTSTSNDVSQSQQQSEPDHSSSATTTTTTPKPTSHDEYSYEEEQEREAMMKNYHHPMKQWFRQDASLTVRLHVCVTHHSRNSRKTD